MGVKRILFQPPTVSEIEIILSDKDPKSYLRFFFLCANISRFIASLFFVFFECDFLFTPNSDPLFILYAMCVNLEY